MTPAIRRLLVAAGLGLAAAVLVPALGIHYRGSEPEPLFWTALLIALFTATATTAGLVILLRGRWPSMIAALALSAVALPLSVWRVWHAAAAVRPRFYHRPDESDQNWNIAVAALGIWAVGLAWAGLLGFPRLREGWPRWVRAGAVAGVIGAAATVTLFQSYLIYRNLFADPFGDSWVGLGGPFRQMVHHITTAVAVMTVALSGLAVLGSVAVPVLARVARIDEKAAAVTVGRTVEAECPRCRLEQTLPDGHSLCRGCGLPIHIDITEPRCDRCGYLLHRLSRPQCPECGAALDPDEVADPRAETAPTGPAEAAPVSAADANGGAA